MARIAVGGFQHETNTFAPQRATWADFERADAWPGFVRGPELIDAVEGFNIPIAGAVKTLQELGHELVPLCWCSAPPSSYVERDAYEKVAGAILDDLAAGGRLDGIYLDLHGAMVAEHHEDGEGELLRRVRALVGDRIPIVTSLDYHTNLTPAVHHDDPIGEAEELGHLGRDHEDGEAVLGPLRHELVDLVLRADVHASSGLVEQEHPGTGLDPLRQGDLLLVPAREHGDLLTDAGRPDPERTDMPLGDLPFHGMPHPEGRRHRLERREGDVLRDVQAENEAGAFAVAREICKALPHRSAGGPDLESLAVDRDLPLLQPAVRAKDAPEQLGIAGALQAGKPDDLAGANGEGDLPDQPRSPVRRCRSRLRHRERLDLQPHGANCRPPHREVPAQLATDHPVDQLRFREVPGQGGSDVLPVAQHGDPIGDAVNLLHPVRDVDDPAAAGLELSHEREQLVDLRPAERAGGLVHDEDARVEGERLGDLDAILDGQRIVLDWSREIDVEVELLAKLPRLPQLGAPIGPLPRGGGARQLTPEEHVVGHRHRIDERHLLVDDGDAPDGRLLGRGEPRGKAE